MWAKSSRALVKTSKVGLSLGGLSQVFAKIRSDWGRLGSWQSKSDWTHVGQVRSHIVRSSHAKSRSTQVDPKSKRTGLVYTQVNYI